MLMDFCIPDIVTYGMEEYRAKTGRVAPADKAAA